MSQLYHIVEPQNLKSSYSEELVSFEFNVDASRAIVANRIRMEASFRVKQNSANLTRDANVKMDSVIGAHNFIESITTESDNAGLLESLNDYARYVRMKHDASQKESDAFNSENQCELKVNDDPLLRDMLRGVPNKKADGANDTTSADNDFSIKPHFFFNNVLAEGQGLRLIQMSKTGTIRVSVQLARANNVFFGDDSKSLSYELTDLKFCFMSVPSSTPSPTANVVQSYISLKNQITTSFVNVSTRVPATCLGVSCSFQTASRENAQKFNNVECEQLPNLKETTFLFQDALNAFVTYNIKDRQDLYSKYLESWTSNGGNGVDHNITYSELKGNDNSNIGLRFSAPLDLTSNKFNIQLTSDVVSNNPYIIYLFFHTLISF